ncbi:hypothetical protein ZWY2020_027312 [Hordeum vulgare]|nr:hypothetical protein ZWY2020_027312 [Hordeum vulgare]
MCGTPHPHSPFITFKRINMHSPTSLSSNVVPRDIPKPASADELAKNGNKKKSFMSNIFHKKGRSGAGADTSDKRPPSRRDRDFLFDLEEKCGERAEFLDATPTVRKSVSVLVDCIKGNPLAADKRSGRAYLYNTEMLRKLLEDSQIKKKLGGAKRLKPQDAHDRTRDEIKLKFDDVTIDEKTYVECFKPGGLMNSKILHLVCDLWSQSMDDAIILQEASVLELLSGTNYKVLKNDLTADKAQKEKERVSVFRAELSASLYNHIGNEKNVVSEVEVDPNEDDGKIVETGDPSANLQEVDRNDEHQNNGSVPLHTSAENTPEELSSGTVAVTAAAVLVAPLETVNIVQPGSSSVATTAPEKNDASQGITVPHVSPPLSPADACELSLLLNPDTLEEPSEARADGSSPNLVPPEAHTSEEHADSSRIAQEDGTFASEHTSLEVQDSEDQEGNEKAEESKTPDTTTKTPSDLLGQRRPVANRRRFSEVNFQNPTLVSTEESDKIWKSSKRAGTFIRHRGSPV